MTTATSDLLVTDVPAAVAEAPARTPGRFSRFLARQADAARLRRQEREIENALAQCTSYSQRQEIETLLRRR